MYHSDQQVITMSGILLSAHCECYTSSRIRLQRKQWYRLHSSLGSVVNSYTTRNMRSFASMCILFHHMKGQQRSATASAIDDCIWSSENDTRERTMPLSADASFVVLPHACRRLGTIASAYALAHVTKAGRHTDTSPLLCTASFRFYMSSNGSSYQTCYFISHNSSYLIYLGWRNEPTDMVSYADTCRT